MGWVGWVGGWGKWGGWVGGKLYGVGVAMLLV